ncbi:MAG: hypothetical protein A2Y25_01190 [Candidatus Melainabacteria bacterium GWF2_37_15]|nr:MAG: hypothetical protein A2Y25_01190 [Candidatus Melainabacteria bacterium GWF2_37_15]
MKNRKGFTLAEVLVTLAVIGVVAALTIPSLIQSSNEKQAKTSIKKALSVMNQALTLSIAQDGVDAAGVATDANLRGLFGGYLSAIVTDTSKDAITTADGMVYTFYATTNCEANLDATPTCFVEVDINGDKGSEAIGTTSSYNDIYYFAIVKEQVFPVNYEQATPLETFIDHADSRGSGNFPTDAAGNVALDALLN